MVKRILILVITLYQKTLSPDHGWLALRYPHGFCKFYPSCSEYTKQAITEYGVLTGTSKGLIRLLKCNPWATPQVDLP